MGDSIIKLKIALKSWQRSKIVENYYKFVKQKEKYVGISSGEEGLFTC